MNQNLATYRISLRTKKWWWPLFANLPDVPLHNAWLIYRLTQANDEEPVDQLQFRRSICTVYYKRYANSRPPVPQLLGRPNLSTLEFQRRFARMGSTRTSILVAHNVDVLFVE
jgi:hypothetical protein